MTQSNKQPVFQAPRDRNRPPSRVQFSLREQRLMDGLREISALLNEQSDPIFRDIGTSLRMLLVRYRIETIREQFS